ncbi:MAG: glucosaminidase domain-containing protein [Phaeodactylibacter sp.]|nr:glucosaminidase domain-containing protein [Phaeodactylibacter sp.]
MKGNAPGLPALLMVLALWNFADKPFLKKNPSRPEKVEQYIEKYRYLSVELNQRTGIPTPIIIAVAGLESDWGTSDLARKANNHFGIKANGDWLGPAHCKPSTEYLDGVPVRNWECFRKYPLIRQSYEDFGRFLLTRPNYRNLRYYPEWDTWSWAIGLQAGGYATDPGYAEKLMAAIEAYRLYEL